ncbi:hypothetical protein J23TS9_51120 [Paenibacillus sp. J23TS9]|uniref:hypothetical protein n=1 Tax=Paenibacillus sp. J23TS9 TaxID=2807193 RepID=UPI001AFE3110|nr:hypothetical protein [Paenibacillus sp. J23TS9]GIP29982.1 hypothetical protein J23TS9_51120 [Paenibacillus sp. J23TS9]
MKQRITIDDLNELSTEQKERLRKWWMVRDPGLSDLYVVKVKYDDVTRYEGPFVNSGHRDFNEDYHKGEALPLLSIGQMIEMVQENLESGLLIEYNNDKVSHYFHWKLSKRILPDSLPSNDITNLELCDLLWLATKTVLAFA